MSYKTEIADENSVAELISIMEYINSKMESCKNAAGIIKRGGKSIEVKELIKGKKKTEPLDLLDLGDDFLEVDENDPIDALFKFVNGYQAKRAENSEQEERKQERKEKNEEKKVEIRRLEEPDLLIDDFEPSKQPNLFDLNTLQIGPNVVPQVVYNPFDQPALPDKSDDFEDFFSDLANRRAF